jgi:NTP pyrophosphatase (non-canonical NTP hydrolase)
MLKQNFTLDFRQRTDITMLTELRDAVHRAALNAGWYKSVHTGRALERNPGEMIALMHSELSEMLEAVRKGNPTDDHLPEFSAEEVEAADLMIRLLDYCGYRGLNIGPALVYKLAYNKVRADHKPEARRAAGGKAF